MNNSPDKMNDSFKDSEFLNNEDPSLNIDTSFMSQSQNSFFKDSHDISQEILNHIQNSVSGKYRLEFQ